MKQIIIFFVCLGTLNIMANDVLCPVGDAIRLKNVKDFSILIPEKATAQEKFSAAMLADYLEKIFKAKLPVIQEPQSVNGQIFSVGNTVRAKTADVTPDPREQAYKLAVSDGNLYILGGTRGPIYGVIALLEEDLGVRWYAGNDAPIVPIRPKDELTVVPRSYSPPFEIRDIFYSDAFNVPWAIFNRIQPIAPQNTIGLEAGGGLANTASMYYIHTYDQLIPAGEYFASHPEYFPLREGKRVPSTQTNGQLCYTCPGLIDTLAQKLDVAIGKNPGTRVYSVSANDNHNSNCECPSCQDIIKVDGVSGAQLYLANEVAKKLAVKYPDIKITTLAYNISQKPPKNIKPGPNTVILYAPIAQRGRAMLLPIGDIKVIADELAGWHKIASSIYLWDYVDQISGAPEPFPNFDAQDGALKFLSDNGVTGVFMQGCYYGHGSLGELKSWLYTKKLWNPQWSQDELIKEFVASYYGPAAAEMSEYVSLQRQAWANFYRTRKTGLKFSNAEIEQMYKLLNSAIVRCGDHDVYRVKIDRELLNLLYLSLAPNPSSATATNYASTLNRAEELISKLKITKYIGEGTTVEDKLRTWHNKLKRATVGNGLPKYSENAVSLKEPFYPVAKYLTDPDAAIGHATRQAGGGDDWGVQWPYGDFIDLLNPETTYIVRMRAKPEFKTTPQKSGNLFIFNSYTSGGANPGTCGKSFEGTFSVNDNNKYRWLVLGKLQIVTPDAVGYLYCVSGELSKDEAVWYDYLEFIPENEFEDKALADKLPLIKIQ